MTGGVSLKLAVGLLSRHGVRALHGDAVSAKLKAGSVYVITLEPPAS